MAPACQSVTDKRFGYRLGWVFSTIPGMYFELLATRKRIAWVQTYSYIMLDCHEKSRLVKNRIQKPMAMAFWTFDHWLDGRNHFHHYPCSPLEPLKKTWWQNPIGSMYGIFTYIHHKNQPNEGKLTKHGSYWEYLASIFPTSTGVLKQTYVHRLVLQCCMAEPTENKCLLFHWGIQVFTNGGGRSVILAQKTCLGSHFK